MVPTKVLLFNALISKAQKQGIEVELCKHCSPPCQEYKNIKLFGKRFNIDMNERTTGIFDIFFNTVEIMSTSDVKYYNSLIK